jgi:hypothetical protein
MDAKARRPPRKNPMFTLVNSADDAPLCRRRAPFNIFRPSLSARPH